ncbi:MAG: hypothetical protein PHD07_08225 [Bacteroidales bacterium]|nr:hypothetical protein [Bacteroidales bacterium]
MVKYLRYWGEFASRDGHLVRVELLQKSESAFTPVEVCFPQSSPLLIEWKNKSKLEPLLSSAATLTLLSLTDRYFVDMYQIEVGAVRMDVYRDSALYWSGCLDTEIYEEPYAYTQNYEVTLTFSDFGMLDRLKWSRTGRESYRTILNVCLSSSGINYISLVEYISTQINASTEIDFSTLRLSNDNFYDEDGEPMTILEVLEGILQPFALRLIQRAGQLYLYDLNGIYSLVKQNLTWQSTDANLSVDKIYNDVTVKFSPYGSDEIVKGEVDVSDTSGAGITIKLSYKIDQLDPVLDGFTIRQGNYVTASGLTLFGNVVYFDIKSENSGSDTAGVLWGFKRGDCSLDTGYIQSLNAACSARNLYGEFTGTKIFTAPLGYLNHQAITTDYKLRINLDLLFDPRYNPFEEAGDYNETDNFNKFLKACNFGYVPVMITLRDNDGVAYYHLENNSIVNSDRDPRQQSGASWVAGEGTPGCMWLCYYDTEDRKNKSGMGGWATNKRCMGHYTGELPESWGKMEDGEYVSLPPSYSGYLEMTVYSGVLVHNASAWDYTMYNKIRWVAYRNPAITIVKKSGAAVEIRDIEDKAYINQLAKESLDIDTILGTLETRTSLGLTCKGILAIDNTIINTFYRAGITARLERLLIGTVYSQYATRKVVLSGTVTIIPGFCVYGDASTPGQFILTGEEQDLIQNESNIQITEFSADNYEGIEYE